MEESILTKFKKYRQKRPARDMRLMQRFLRLASVQRDQQRLHLADPLFRAFGRFRPGRRNLTLLPFFRDFENRFRQNAESNDAKFEVLPLLRQEQLGSLHSRDLMPLLQPPRAGQPSPVPEEPRACSMRSEDADRDGESQEEPDSPNNSDFASESEAERCALGRGRSDPKHFDGLFDSGECDSFSEDEVDLEMETIGFVLSKKDKAYLKNFFVDWCQLEVIREALDELEKLRLAPAPASRVKPGYFDLFEQNREELNHNGARRPRRD